MKLFVLLSAATIAAVLGAQPTIDAETTTTAASSTTTTSTGASDVKNDAAAGRHRHRDRDDDDYEEDYYGGSSYGHQYLPPLLRDRFVCDLDASVLLVVGSNRHHHHHRRHSQYGGANRAVRVKCSEVATLNEDSCLACCQQTARRDTTLANDKLFGFLAITKTDDDKTFTRNKRSTDDDDDEDDDDDHKKHRRNWHHVEPTYLENAQWSPPTYKTNVKCICCAPRPTPPAASPPVSPYGNAPNTFQAPVVAPVPVAAAQPIVDTWGQDAAPVAWGAASDAPAAAPAPTPAPGNNNQW